MNKFLKMDFKGQTAVLSAFVLVGMMFLVPAITEKALASITAVVTGTCGPEGETHPCGFALVSKDLSEGKWVKEPTASGTSVGWETFGYAKHLPLGGGPESGNVVYDVGGGQARLSFSNPAFGASIIVSPGYKPPKNTCGVYIERGSPGLSGSCHAGAAMCVACTFTYTLRSVEKTGAQQEQESQTGLQKQDCMQLKEKMANDEAAAAQYKSKDCESLLK